MQQTERFEGMPNKTVAAEFYDELNHLNENKLKTAMIMLNMLYPDRGESFNRFIADHSDLTDEELVDAICNVLYDDEKEMQRLYSHIQRDIADDDIWKAMDVMSDRGMHWMAGLAGMVLFSVEGMAGHPGILTSLIHLVPGYFLIGLCGLLSFAAAMHIARNFKQKKQRRKSMAQRFGGLKLQIQKKAAGGNRLLARSLSTSFAKRAPAMANTTPRTKTPRARVKPVR